MNLRRGQLADQFLGVGAKTLRSVDTTAGKSTQHEVNGSAALKAILGEVERKIEEGRDNRYFARFIWLGAEQEAISEEGRLSWYDTRKNKPHRSAEWRLYYQGNAVTEMMKPGDALFIARQTDDKLVFVVAPGGETIQQQLVWLFGLPPLGEATFSVKDVQPGATLDFAARLVLDEIGVEYEEPNEAALDRILAGLGEKFPPTAVMSELARASLPEADPRQFPDLALAAWLEREEQLFRRLERRIVSVRLDAGFGSPGQADVDGFLSFSLSVQNRRKARMGLSLENHLGTIFDIIGLKYTRTPTTENASRPDFIFPGAREYHDPSFPSERLLMLAAKSTCKDRWRQVLAEADRVPDKHLITLEPSISIAQTREMQAKRLQLVLPAPLHKTYTAEQQSWLMSLADFIDLANSRRGSTR